jgi:membrane-bound lytic murein transglycosylase D
MRFLAAAFIFCGVASIAQPPQVPHKLHFAGMTLTVHADARAEIQKDVDRLHSSPRYFGLMVERAKTYFPIIEKTFKDERVPDDLKYLVLQESALISNAVSTSNAVGYWQFKAETAKEMGLLVNSRVDERMNIVAASKGAAKYFKQSNNYFNNWLYVVQSYQMGIGGTMRAVGEEHLGSKHMDVTTNTYWYVKKYLAHKVAFEHALGGSKGQVQVTPIFASGVSLDEISAKSGVEASKLKEYNTWIKDGAIPDDKEYAVVIPNGDVTDFHNLWLTPKKSNMVAATETPVPTSTKEFELNGLRAITAQPGESITALAKRTNTDLSDFIRWNDVSVDWPVQAGQTFYLQRKIKTSNKSTHSAKAGESLWAVSQTYGIRLKTLKRLNGNMPDNLQPGTVVYLTEKPGKTAVTFEQILQIDPNSPFEWGISGKSEADYVIAVNNPVQPKTQQMTNPAAKPNPGEHVVAAGETLYSIAARYSLKPADLIRINKLREDEAIKPGQLLKTLDKEEVTLESTIHVVKPSDTVYSIARQYGLTVKQLLELNKMQGFDLKPGQKLVVR